MVMSKKYTYSIYSGSRGKEWQLFVFLFNNNVVKLHFDNLFCELVLPWSVMSYEHVSLDHSQFGGTKSLFN